MGIGLVQQSTRCSDSPWKPWEELCWLEPAVVTETELIQIWLIITAASMVCSQEKCLEIANRNMNPLEISGFISWSIDKNILQTWIAFILQLFLSIFQDTILFLVVGWLKPIPIFIFWLCFGASRPLFFVYGRSIAQTQSQKCHKNIELLWPPK